MINQIFAAIQLKNKLSKLVLHDLKACELKSVSGGSGIGKGKEPLTLDSLKSIYGGSGFHKGKEPLVLKMMTPEAFCVLGLDEQDHIP